MHPMSIVIALIYDLATPTKSQWSPFILSKSTRLINKTTSFHPWYLILPLCLINLHSCYPKYSTPNKILSKSCQIGHLIWHYKISSQELCMHKVRLVIKHTQKSTSKQIMLQCAIPRVLVNLVSKSKLTSMTICGQG